MLSEIPPLPVSWSSLYTQDTCLKVELQANVDILSEVVFEVFCLFFWSQPQTRLYRNVDSTTSSSFLYKIQDTIVTYVCFNCMCPSCPSPEPGLHLWCCHMLYLWN